MVALGSRRQGVPALEARRREHAHLQPLVVPARRGVGRCCCSPTRADMTWGFERGADPVLSAAHVSRDLSLIAMPGQYLFGVTPMTMAAVATTFVFSAIYYAVDRQLLLRRLARADRRVPRHAPAVHRSGDVAAHRARAHLVRRALRAHHRSLVRPAARANDARASTTSCCRCRCSTCPSIAARPAGAVAAAQGASIHRRGAARLAAAPPSSRLHGRVGGRLRRDERVRVPGRRASRAMDAVLGAGVRGRTSATPA